MANKKIDENHFVDTVPRKKVPAKKKKAVKKIKVNRIEEEPLSDWQILAMQELMPLFKYFEKPQYFQDEITVSIPFEFSVGWDSYDGEDEAWSTDKWDIGWDEHIVIDEMENLIEEKRNEYNERVEKMNLLVMDFSRKHGLLADAVYRFLNKNCKNYTGQNADPSISPHSKVSW